MERALSMEDKIRKAEEIYYRRNNVKAQNISQEAIKTDFKISLIRKITVQTLVSACIFTGIFAVLNNETYSKSFKKNIDEILTYNIDFKGLYEKYIVKDNEKLKKQEEILIEPTQENIEEQEQTETQETLGITTNEEIESINEEAEDLDQMTIDAQYINQNVSIIKPLNGVITSRFGMRENVEPLYHTGIDIAANTGTEILSAMEGTAELVSTEGSYGKHIKITNGEVSTLYAHCSTLCIKQGDYIKQGEKIAEVGSTGNATGPHLHFEIIRNGEHVNPELIINF